jgi:hypothetical protein
MSMKHAFFRILLLLIILPPPTAHPASSDSFPWSSTSNNNPADLSTGVRRDAYGALRDANMQPDTIPLAVPQKSTRNTYSTNLPLFTPSIGANAGRDLSGNTMQIDPNIQAGSNMETDSNVQTGLIAPGGTVSGSGIAQGNVGPTQSGPGAAGLFTPNSPGNAAAFNAQVNGGLAGSPIVDGNGANIHVTVPVATPSVVPSYEQFSNGVSTDLSSSYSSDTTMGGRLSTPAPLTFGRVPIPLQPPINIQVDVNAIPTRVINPAPNAVSRLRTNRIYRARLVMNTMPQVRHQTSADAVKSIGEVTGSISYADGQKIIFGTHGNATVNARNATVSLPNGKVIPLRIAGPAMNKIAQKNQVPL